MEKTTPTANGLTQEQGQALLRLARTTIEQALGLERSKGEPQCTDLVNDPVLQEQRGTFVTLKLHGELRGCIGNLAANEAIVEGVQRNALNAAFSDPRFRAVSAEELAQIQMEISILTKPEPLPYRDGAELLSLLRPGIDGLVLRKGDLGATFLPQVWEQLPVPEEFLGALCHKAHLPADAWRTGKLEVSVYQVQHFEE